jgi:hypothetical protein
VSRMCFLERLSSVPMGTWQMTTAEMVSLLAKLVSTAFGPMLGDECSLSPEALFPSVYGA